MLSVLTHLLVFILGVLVMVEVVWLMVKFDEDKS